MIFFNAKKQDVMKFLKYSLLILAILIFGFLAVGILKPTATYEHEVMVEKSRQEAWAVFQDPEKLPDWLSGFERMEHVSGTPGAVGAVSRVYFTENGESMSVEETILDLQPPTYMKMRYVSDFMDMDYEVRLSEQDGATRLQSRTTVQGNGLFAKSMLAFMGGTLLQQEIDNMTKLKTAIEQNAKTY